MGAEQSRNETTEIISVNNKDSSQPNKEAVAPQNLSKLKPLLPHSASYGIIPTDHVALRQISPRHLIELFTVYEEHLRQTSSVVSGEQNVLSRDIKQADTTVSNLLAVTQKKNNIYTAWSSNIQSSVKDINAQLLQMQKTVDGLVPLVSELNEMLPVDEKMAPFSLNSPD